MPHKFLSDLGFRQEYLDGRKIGTSVEGGMAQMVGIAFLTHLPWDTFLNDNIKVRSGVLYDRGEDPTIKATKIHSPKNDRFKRQRNITTLKTDHHRMQQQ